MRLVTIFDSWMAGGSIDRPGASYGPRSASAENPIPSPAGDTAGAPLATSIVQGGEKGLKRVLVVEDDADTRVFLEVLLRNAGFEVTVAANGLEGYRQATLFRPDVVVTDLMMPIMDGLELCAVLRTQMQVPVVLITAHSPPMHRAIWDDYFDKPLEIPRLIGAVQRLASGAQ